MRFEQIAPFLRFIGLSTTSKDHYDEMVGYESRMFYIVDGSGILEIQNKPYMLRKGDLAIINSGVSYKIRFAPGTVKCYMIKFDCTQEHADKDKDNPADIPEKFDSKKILSHMDFEDAPQFNEYFILSNMEQIEKLFRMMFEEERKRLIGWRATANGLLAEILTKALRTDTGYSNTSRLKEVLDYLHANFNSPISNAQIASKFGYHPNYLSNLFVKITGKSMHQYLISLRIARAAELLETGKLPVAQVAVTCGFENSSKFSAVFKKEFGRTPTQYRKNSRLQ